MKTTYHPTLLYNFGTFFEKTPSPCIAKIYFVLFCNIFQTPSTTHLHNSSTINYYKMNNLYSYMYNFSRKKKLVFIFVADCPQCNPSRASFIGSNLQHFMPRKPSSSSLLSRLRRAFFTIFNSRLSSILIRKDSEALATPRIPSHSALCLS